MFNFKNIDSDTATTFGAYGENGSTFVVFPKTLLASSAMGNAVKGLLSGLDLFGRAVADAGAKYNAPTLKAVIPKIVTDNVSQHYNAMVARAIVHRDETLEFYNTVSSPLHAPVTDGAETRNWLRSLPLMDRVEAALSNSDVAAHVIAAPHLAGVTKAEFLSRISNYYALECLTDRLMSDPEHVLEPSLHNVIASGPDRAAANRRASEILAANRASMDEVDVARTVAEQTVQAVSYVAGVNIADGFALLNDGEA